MMLQEIRFRCINTSCIERLTYDQILLGTHELDQCTHMMFECQGCNISMERYKLLRHEAVECLNPTARCRYCKTVMRLTLLSDHEKNCSARQLVKVEYANDSAVTANLQEHLMKRQKT